MITISGCAIIKDNKLFLLKKFKNNYFEFPGGKVDLNERVEDAATREVFEEVGVRVVLKKKFGPYLFEHKNKLVESVVFTCEFDGTLSIVETNVFEKSIWINLDEFEKYELALNVELFIQDFLKSSTS
jgi:8-oxo-dGTP diphosphatase